MRLHVCGNHGLKIIEMKFLIQYSAMFKHKIYVYFVLIYPFFLDSINFHEFDKSLNHRL